MENILRKISPGFNLLHDFPLMYLPPETSLTQALEVYREVCQLPVTYENSHLGSVLAVFDSKKFNTLINMAVWFVGENEIFTEGVNPAFTIHTRTQIYKVYPVPYQVGDITSKLQKLIATITFNQTIKLPWTMLIETYCYKAVPSQQLVFLNNIITLLRAYHSQPCSIVKELVYNIWRSYLCPPRDVYYICQQFINTIPLLMSDDAYLQNRVFRQVSESPVTAEQLLLLSHMYVQTELVEVIEPLIKQELAHHRITVADIFCFLEPLTPEYKAYLHTKLEVHFADDAIASLTIDEIGEQLNYSQHNLHVFELMKILGQVCVHEQDSVLWQAKALMRIQTKLHGV